MGLCVLWYHLMQGACGGVQLLNAALCTSNSARPVFSTGSSARVFVCVWCIWCVCPCVTHLTLHLWCVSVCPCVTHLTLHLWCVSVCPCVTHLTLHLWCVSVCPCVTHLTLHLWCVSVCPCVTHLTLHLPENHHSSLANHCCVHVECLPTTVSVSRLYDLQYLAKIGEYYFRIAPSQSSSGGLFGLLGGANGFLSMLWCVELA